MIMEWSHLSVKICIIFIGLAFISSSYFSNAQSWNIRLVGGTSANEGRVEVFYNGQWGTVCDDNFDHKDAAVVCSMLGFSRTNAKAKQSASFGQGTGQIWMDDIQCTDTDTDLFQCQQRVLGSHDCSHREDAGVVCQKTVRLAGGSNGTEGRVEIFYNNEWGTVCDDSWTDTDAAVVCSMLGYSRGGAIAWQGGHFPEGSGPIMLDDVSCTGTESAISECQHSGWKSHNCYHSEDAGVSCRLSSCGAADILIIMDESGSVGQTNFDDMKAFVKDVIRGLNSPLFRFSVITFSGTVHKAFGFSDYLTVADILSAVDRIDYSEGSTNTGAALRFARESIFNVKRSGAVNIVILFTDGKSNNRRVTTEQAVELRSRQVRIFSIGVGSGPKIEELKAIASSPSDEHVFQVSSFAALSRIQSAIQKRTCEASVDGGFSEWSTWTTCTRTCGTGTKSRSRTCTNPVPAYNGRNCSGIYRQLVSCTIAGCPVDGQWSGWTPWSVCSVSCGDGYQRRSRGCTNPRPQNGGTLCSGASTEILSCNSGSCPIHGGFSPWSDWNSCSKSCGFGTKSRNRSCTNPAPQYNGRNCTGAYRDTDTCLKTRCPVNGGWSLWSIWTQCSVSCGGGKQRRERRCDNPSPRYGGHACSGINQEEIDCNANPCPIDGDFTQWGDWSPCSKTCSLGERIRIRTCTDPLPKYNGSNCSGAEKETENCMIKLCPVDGGWSAWNSWTHCNASCGGGRRERDRVCNNPRPRNAGRPCFGRSKHNMDCNTNPCPIDGQFGLWEGWSLCSKSCGKGTQNRVRQCNSPYPRYGGRNCTDNFSETKNCNTQNCPIDGGFSEWISWTDCSVSCGGGIKNRTRFCDSPIPSYGGKNCSGNFSEETPCKTFSCPIDGYFDEWEAWSPCSHSCGGGIQTRERICFDPKYGGRACKGHFIESLNCNTNRCPIDGVFSEWNAWTPCTKSCDGGTKKRSRQCDNPKPMYGGNNCRGVVAEKVDCNSFPCPIDGKFSDWSDWSTCSSTCGGGSRSRSRSCSNPSPRYGGKPCTGHNIEYSVCNIRHCPIDGGFSEWGIWATCTVTCGGGNKSRSRRCNLPAPAFGGMNCSGLFFESSSCETSPCPVDGGIGSWGEWTLCSVSCGGGIQIRNRSCDSPVPKFGGKDCDDEMSNFQVCNTNECPVDGKYTEWGAWTACSITCGGGKATRIRTCTNPPPQFGGKTCFGDEEENKTCNSLECPVDGMFSEWNAWSECSVTCGGGTALRERDCSNPAPQYGGRRCEGPSNETKTCNTDSCSICESPSEEFECHDKAFCVPNSYKCDGIADCDDESDEKAETCSSGPSISQLCPEGLYMCQDGSCKHSQYDC